MSSKSMGNSADKKQGVTMGMDVLDCPVCLEPLKPPILQCSVGHFICSSCRGKLKKCPVCSRTSFERCFGMERVVESILVPCSYAVYGCTEKVTYFNKKSHEQACSHGPCSCPDSGCSFAGPVAMLWKHFTTQHKWPSTAFEYYAPFDLRVKPGVHLLRANNGQLFVMNMVPVEPVGHGVSLVCVQPNTLVSSFGCNVIFSSFTGHHQISTLDSVRCSSLSDGLPKDYFCIVSKAVVALPSCSESPLTLSWWTKSTRSRRKTRRRRSWRTRMTRATTRRRIKGRTASDCPWTWMDACARLV